MRIVFFDAHRLGVIAGDRVVDVTGLVGAAGLTPQARLEALVAGWAALAPALRRRPRAGPAWPWRACACGPPCPGPASSSAWPATTSSRDVRSRSSTPS